MTKEYIKFIIYLVGVAILGLAYYPIKEALSPWLFVVVAISYLLILRFLAAYVHKKVSGRGEAVGA